MKKDTSKNCSIDNYTVILSKSKVAHTGEILRSLRSLRMTLSKYISLSKGEGQGEGFITNKVNELINKPSPAFVVFANAQTQLLPLTKREGKRNLKELINLSTYPLINFNKNFPRPLRDTSRTGELESRVRLRAVWLRARERGKKAAFTLAETLITLGIIGVVAAITIPGLITAYKKHVIGSSLKRAVSSINQAIKQSETENGEMESWNKSLDQEEFINLYIRPYMNIALTCKDMTKCGYKSNTTWKNLNGKYQIYYGPIGYGRVPFITMDGILYLFSSVNTPEYIAYDNDKTIIIDINGPKPPNMHGQDVFILYRKEAEDSIVPYGAGLPLSEIKKSCNTNSLGLYCAAWIYQNGWNIPSGYPLR